MKSMRNIKEEVKILVRKERKKQILSYQLNKLSFQDFSLFLLPTNMSNN